MYTASATTPLTNGNKNNSANAVNYGAVSPQPVQTVQVLVDDNLPWPAVYQQRRKRRARRRRGCCSGACNALIRFFLLLTILCVLAAGVFLVWEHRVEVWHAIRDLGVHIGKGAKEIIRWMEDRLRDVAG
jgi:hypothetical protein